MKSLWLLVVLVAVAIAFLWYRHTQLPDVQLGARLGKLCAVAEAHRDDGKGGVEALFGYLGENTPALFRDFGRLLVEIERTDDESHDDRARAAVPRVWGPIASCPESLQRFAEAIERDPEAKARLDAGVTRLGRTLEILFGQQGARLAAPVGLGRLLPRQLARTLQ